MNVLSLTGVSKTFRDAPLFEDVTLGIDAGDKIGFVGRNGSGKSTLLKILSGEIEPDAGSVSRNRELRISSLEQQPAFDPDATLEAWFERAGAGAGGVTVASSFRSYCRELGLDTSARMSTLSGGMIRKATLARCLAPGAGLVTFDEPTNHLDLDTIEWLEALLKKASFGFVLVTHDRMFLDAVCGAIMEIDGRRVYKYPGDYSSFVARKEARDAAGERAEERRVTILRRELEWLKRGPKARTGKDKARKDRVQDLLDSGTQAELTMREFSSAHRRLGKKVLELHGISKSYGGETVIRPFTYMFRRGERIGVIGPNGSGKTTFLQLVSNRLDPDTGTAVKGENTVFGCFDQTTSLGSGKVTVVDYIRAFAERVQLADGASLSPEQLLERFLFPRPMQSQPIERLSGGELRRLDLVRILATAPNFLLLDEPTNDLDLDTIRLLEDYLVDFPGCILLVSHDRALLERLTDYLFVFDGTGGIRGFAGSYLEYRDVVAAEARDVRAAAAKDATQETETRRPARREKTTGLSFKEKREYELLESEIAELEEERRSLDALFQQPVRDPVEIEKSHRRYHEIEALLEARIALWEELASRA
jgi:ABC transport system ATP-binding/permease protein